MATSLNLTELEQGATYEFQVIAKGNGTTYDDSDASTTVSWTTKTKLATPNSQPRRPISLLRLPRRL